MRLDRLMKRAELITFRCWDCRQRATVVIADIIRERGGDTNANAVGEGLLDCPDPYARRNGRFCRFRAAGMPRPSATAAASRVAPSVTAMRSQSWATTSCRTCGAAAARRSRFE
jgi:hypothetical protein